MNRRLAAAIFANRRAILAAGVLLTVASIVLVSRVRAETSLQAMIGDRAPSSRALAHIIEHYAVGEELLIHARAPADHAFARRELVDLAQRVEELAAAHPDLITRVRYRVEDDAAGYIEDVLVPAALLMLSDDGYAALRQRLTPESIRAQVRQNEALLAAPGTAGLAELLLRDPLRVREFLAPALADLAALSHGDPAEPLFLSPDGRSLLVRIRAARPASDLPFAKRITTAVTEIIAVANESGLETSVTGAHAIAARSERAMRHDLTLNIAGASVLLALAFLIGYRSPVIGAIALGVAAVGILWGFAIHSIFRAELTPVTAVIGGILAGLGVDYAIHTLSHLRSPGADRRDSLAALLPGLGAAAATSIVGFLAVSRSSVQMIRDFGALGALGLAGVLVASITILPAFVAPRRAAPDSRAASLDVAIAILARRPRRFLAIGAATVAIAAVIALLGHPIRLAHDAAALHPRPNAPLDALDRIADEFGFSPDSYLVHLTAPTDEALVMLSHEIDRRLRDDRAGVIAHIGPANFIPDPSALAARRARSLDADRIIADFRAALDDSIFDPAAFATAEEFLRSLASPAAPPSLSRLREYDEIASMILPPAASPAPEAIITVLSDPLAPRATVVETLRRATSGMENATLTGMDVISHEMSGWIRADLGRTMRWAGLGVLAVLAVTLRRAGDVLLALAPGAFAGLILLAYIRTANEPLNLLNLIALPMLAGLAVDQGIFTVGALRTGLRDGAVRARAHLASTAHAMLMASITTTLAFGSLALSSTPAMQSLGRLTAIGMVASFVGCLLVPLPVVLVRLNRLP